jgi:hypothetical protein
MYTMPGGLGSDFCKNQEETMGRHKKSTGGDTGFNIINGFNGILALNTQAQIYRLSHFVTHKGLNGTKL